MITISSSRRVRRLRSTTVSLLPTHEPGPANIFAETRRWRRRYPGGFKVVGRNWHRWFFAKCSKQLQDGVEGIAGLSMLTPRHEALFASIGTVRHERADAHKFFGYLLEKHRLRCRPVTEQGLEAVRISTHVFTSRADCERAIRAVHAAAQAL